MKLSKLSNQTNSQDPQAVNSRVFVGNLNTFQCSKTDVERMFQKYGRLAGISMHKGYAFVQFLNPYDARNACHGEDGRNILSQVLDVNMVAEPKAHQIGRNRQNVTKTGNDWDYYYDSYCTSTMCPTQSPRPIKRQRLMTPQTVNGRGGSGGNGLVNAQLNAAQQQQMMLSTSPTSNGGGGQHSNHHMHQQHQQQTQQQQYGGSPNGGGGGHLGHHHHLNQNHHHHHSALVSLMQNMVNNNGGGGGGATGTAAGSLVAAELLAHQSSAFANVAAPAFASIAAAAQQQHHQQQMHNNGSSLLGPFKVYSTPDTLICGNCRECFAELGELLDHKRSYCKLRFSCKCQEASVAAGAATSYSTANVSRRPSSTPSPPGTNQQPPLPPPPPPSASATASSPTTTVDGRLSCAMCKCDFAGAWELMVHVQTAHSINIYELNTAECGGKTSTTIDDGPAAGVGVDGPAPQTTAQTDGVNTSMAPTIAAQASSQRENNTHLIIGLDKLNQHCRASAAAVDTGSALSVIATGLNGSASSSSSSSMSSTSTDSHDCHDLNDGALLSPASSSSAISIKDEVLLFNLLTPSLTPSSNRQHYNASPASSSASAGSPYPHHPHHPHHHHVDSSKRNGSTYSSRNSSPRPESASPTRHEQEQQADSAQCLMSAALSIESAGAGAASALGNIVTSSLALGMGTTKGSSITTQ